MTTSSLTTSDDPFELSRFLDAQESAYARVLAELRAGRKQSHWMWYFFPQIAGLGSSSTSVRYAIRSFDEARAYLNHPVLGARLTECVEIALGLTDCTASAVFGYPDDLKFRSSLTLFELVAGEESIFSQALEKYFNGERDARTIELAGQ